VEKVLQIKGQSMKKILINLLILGMLLTNCQRKKTDDTPRNLLLFYLLSQPSFESAPYSKFLYTVNRGSNDIYAFRIDPASGTLTAINTTSTDRSPSHLVVNVNGSRRASDGLFAYVTNWGSNTISGYKITKENGQIDPISNDRNNTVVATSGTQPMSAVFDPTGQYLLVANSGSDNVSVFTFNTTSGAITLATTTNLVGVDTNTGNGGTSTNENDDSTPISIIFHPTTSRFVYTANYKSDKISNFTFDLITPASPLALVAANEVTIAPSGQAGAAPRDITFEPTGRFAYVVNQRDNSLSYFVTELDPTSANYGRLSPVEVGTPPVALGGTVAATNPLVLTQEGFDTTSPYKMAVDPTGRFLYVLYFAARKVGLFNLDSFTGIPSLIATYDTGSNPSDIAVDQSGRYMYLTNSGDNTINTYAIDPANGRLAAKGSIRTGIEPVEVKLY
jgi:6-phosphogluconolactonase